MILIESLKKLLNSDYGLIDLRSSEEFIKEHIKGSTSLPWSRLPDSMHELPANHQIIGLLGDKDLIEKTSSFLLSKNYKINKVFTLSTQLWKELKKENLLESGSHSVQLWQANPQLKDVIGLMENQISGRNALDIACGAGRDTVYLASRGWKITAIDNKTDALNRCQNLAKLSNVSIKTRRLELELGNSPLSDFSVDLVVVMRYLHRPLLPDIDKTIKPGGGIIYSTFMEGSEKFGSPRNPAYLLKKDELKNFFSSYKIVIDEQRFLPDGRPVSIFAAIKPK